MATYRGPVPGGTATDWVAIGDDGDDVAARSGAGALTQAVGTNAVSRTATTVRGIRFEAITRSYPGPSLLPPRVAYSTSGAAERPSSFAYPCPGVRTV
jgi:hypothetical protein